MISVLLLIIVILQNVSSIYSGGALGPGAVLFAGAALKQPQRLESSNGQLSVELSVESYRF